MIEPFEQTGVDPIHFRLHVSGNFTIKIVEGGVTGGASDVAIHKRTILNSLDQVKDARWRIRGRQEAE